MKELPIIAAYEDLKKKGYRYGWITCGHDVAMVKEGYITKILSLDGTVKNDSQWCTK